MTAESRLYEILAVYLANMIQGLLFLNNAIYKPTDKQYHRPFKRTIIKRDYREKQIHRGLHLSTYLITSNSFIYIFTLGYINS